MIDMIDGKPAYLVGKTAKARNKRFPKLAKPRDTRWISRGSGVVYTTLTPRQQARKEALRYERLSLDALQIAYDTNVGEQRLIKR